MSMTDWDTLVASPLTEDCPRCLKHGTIHIHGWCPWARRLPVGWRARLHGLIGHRFIQPDGIGMPMHCQRCGVDREMVLLNANRSLRHRVRTRLR